ncbi:MAG: DsbA family protein [Acidobacteriota bacterium]
MTESVDVYWSFRSPYSYLVTPDLRRLQEDFDVTVHVRVVLPIAVRDASLLFDASNRKPAQYIVHDSRRRAEFLGLPMRWPQPDPVVQDLTTMAVAEEQPHIFRLSSLGVEAERRGRGVALISEVSSLIFGGTEDWDQGDHLRDAVARAGLDLGDLEAALEEGDHLKEIEGNQKALDAAGHWGVPTMVVRDEPFFGQDRIDTLRWRLDQYGLSKS